MTKSPKLMPEFSLTYEFRAPRVLVFEAFSTAEALAEWWGPVECVNTVVRLDFRPGGIFHFKMEKEGNVTYGRFRFGRIEPPSLLEFTNAFADKHGNVIPTPFDPALPQEIHYLLRFKEKKGRTTITLKGTPVQPSPEGLAAFRSINGSMQQGFSATFNNLSRYLESKPESNYPLA